MSPKFIAHISHYLHCVPFELSTNTQSYLRSFCVHRPILIFLIFPRQLLKQISVYLSQSPWCLQSFISNDGNRWQFRHRKTCEDPLQILNLYLKLSTQTIDSPHFLHFSITLIVEEFMQNYIVLTIFLKNGIITWKT